jgi:arabinogalactan endo-1,4-beta-galactosidase
MGLTDFDILAISYYLNYPGHSMGNWASFAALGKWLKSNYGKDFMILETSYPYTLVNADSQTNVYYAGLYESGGTTSPAKQRTFFAEMAQSVKDGGGLGMITWGSESLATNAYIYANDSWGKGSSWDNNSYWNEQNNLHEGINWMEDL